MSPPDDQPSAGGEVPPSQAIVEAVATHEGVEVTDIEPPAYASLYSVVNPEALDRLFRTPGSPDDARIRFTYEGYVVVVYGDGAVDVYEEPGRDDSLSNPVEE